MSDDMDVDSGDAMETEVVALPSPHQQQRRGSMSQDEERQRRASIKAIMADQSVPEHERRRSIQYLMDGRRSSLGGGGTTTPPEIDVSYGGAVNNYQNPDFNQSQSIPSADLLQESCSSFTASGPLCNEQTKRSELTRPECTHYARNCTMIAPCCGAAFGCRICHDDCPVLPPKIVVQQVRRRYARSSSLPSSFTNMNQATEDTHHTIDRFAVKEVICRICYTRQSSKT
jgi:CHY zinc finger